MQESQRLLTSSDQSGFNDEVLNRTFFFAGWNPRNISEFLSRLNIKDQKLINTVFKDLYSIDKDKKKYKDLIEAINDKLQQKNQELLSKLIDSNIIQSEYISKIDWKEWKGLNPREINDILSKLNKIRRNKKKRRYDHLDVQILIDRSYFSGPQELETIYALTPFNLCMYQINRSQDGNSNYSFDFIKEIPKIVSSSAKFIKDFKSIIDNGKSLWNAWFDF